MSPWVARGRRAAALLVGLLLGLIFVGLIFWFYTQTARERALRHEFLQALDLPADAFRLEEVREGRLIVTARNLVLLDTEGDTVVSAPSARFSFSAAVLAGTGPIVIADLELRNPYLRLVQLPTGDWNVQRALRLTVDDQEIAAPDDGRPILLTGVRVTGGRVLLATPWAPEDPGLGTEDLRIVRLYGQAYRVRTAAALEARFPEVRVGGQQGWRVEIAQATAVFSDPNLRLAQLRGVIEEAPDGFALDIATLRTDRSVLAGAGRVRTVADRMVFDIEATFDPVDFRDLRWIAAAIPAEGQARGQLTAVARADGRTVATLRNLEVQAFDSRVEGRLTVLFGGDQPVAFRDTDLLLDPLDLGVSGAFGFVEQVPYDGQVRGRIATLGEFEGVEGPLNVDLVATVTPRDLPLVPPSTVTAQGVLALEAQAGVRLDGVRVGLRALQLAALRPLLPEQEEWLRGVVQGTAEVSGTLRDLRFADGDLTYEVGQAAPTRLAGLTGFVRLEPELRFDLSAIAQPLELATVAEFVPAFPFRRAPLSGPIEVAGTAEQLRFTTNLRGEIGGFVAQGAVTLGEVPSFRVSGRLDALQPARLLREEVPFAGPVSGPFRVEGTLQDFRYDVDLTQALGRFALEGRVQLPPDIPPVLEATGEVVDFRIGTLLGRTGLFTSPLTGQVRISGGGHRAYAFDLDLSGLSALLDVEGWFMPGAVPSYSASGRVAGLDLRLVPGLEQLPPTNLVAAFSVQGRGTTPEELAGQLALDATGSVVGGIPVQAATARMVVEAGILYAESLELALAGTQLAASGTWGLTRPAPQPLQFSLTSPDLTALLPILRSMQMIEPQLTGSLSVRGTVAGTVEYPILDVEGSGRNLRFDGWRAAAFALRADIARTTQGWTGEATASGTDVVLQDTEQFQAIELTLAGTPDSVAVSLAARRDRLTEATLAGTLELQQGTPIGIELQSLVLRVAGTDWQLQQPSRVRWDEQNGLHVDGLVLQREGAEEGLIVVDGRIDPAEEFGFRVNLINVDIGEFRELIPGAPALEGVLTLQATLEGPATAPDLTIGGRVEGFRYLDAVADAISLTARYADGQMVADAAIWQGGAQIATAVGTIPMRISFDELVPQVELLDAQPLDARLVADSLPMALIVAAIPLVSRGAGLISAEVRASGPLGSPSLHGSARVSRGALTVDELNVRYEAIEGNLALEGQSVVIESLTARSLGSAVVRGRITLDDLRRPLFDLSGSFDQFRGMNRTDVATVLVSGSAAVRGRYPTPTLTGRVELTSGNITLPPLEEEEFGILTLDLIEVVGDPLPTAVLEPTFVEQIRIQNLEVLVGEGVWAISPELRVNIGGELLVSRFGPEQWQVFGEVQARRGTYTLSIRPLVREFDVVSGRIEFFGTPDLNPALDIVAQHRVRATGPGATGVLNILVNVTGTAQFPRITLTTDTQPPLPESEILSYLIFGRPTFALGEVGGALAQRVLLQELAGGVLATQIEQLIRQAGLPFDYIRVRGRPSPREFVDDPLGATTLEVGWQLFPDVFLTVEWGVGVLFGGDAGETWGLNLEWQIDPQWSTRLGWEPLRRDPILRRQNLVGGELTRQFSLDLRRRWEYGVSPEPDDATTVVEP